MNDISIKGYSIYLSQGRIQKRKHPSRLQHTANTQPTPPASPVMKLLPVLFGLVTSVAAIDTRLYLDNVWCNGRWIGCKNLNPNVCCGLSKPGKSASFEAIPTNWALELRVYYSTNCNENPNDKFYFPTTVPGQPNRCYFNWSREGLQSMGYGFRRGRKREVVSVPGKECQKPDAYGLEDGTEFDLRGMDEEMIEALLKFDNATSVADLPEQFKEYQV